MSKAPTLKELRRKGVVKWPVEDKCPKCGCGFLQTYDDGVAICLHCDYRSAETTTINRIEVIGTEGRMFVKYLDEECIAEVKYQDGGKTMKVFLMEAQK